MRAFPLLLLAFGLLLAGCAKRLPQHDGASFGIYRDGKTVAWTTGSGSNNILRLKDATGTIRDVATGNYFEGPSFTPDGKSVLVATGQNFRSKLSLTWIDLATGTRKPFIPIEAHTRAMPSVSPDGKWVAFIEGNKPKSESLGGVQWSDFDLCIATIDGKEIVRLSDQKSERVTTPRWSSGSDKVVLSGVDKDGIWQTRVYDVYARKETQKIVGQNNESMPTFIRDRIAIVSDRVNPGKYKVVFVFAGDGSDMSKLQPITPQEGFFLDLQATDDRIYALEDVGHKMRFRVSAIDPATGAITEVVPESQFDEKKSDR